MDPIRARNIRPLITLYDGSSGETVFVERVNRTEDAVTIHGILFMGGHAFDGYEYTYDPDDGALYELPRH